MLWLFHVSVLHVVSGMLASASVLSYRASYRVRACVRSRVILGFVLVLLYDSWTALLTFSLWRPKLVCETCFERGVVCPAA